MKRVIPLTALLISATSVLHAEDDKKRDNSGFPSLEMLPEGSILEVVKLPRYDKNFQPISLLTADDITVKENSLIDANNVYIEFYNDDESVKLKTRMKHATYHQRKAILKSTGHTVIDGKNFHATGTALTMEEKSQQGFLKGPVTTEFIIPNKKKSASMNLNKSNPPITASRNTAKKVVSGVLITATSGMLMAERPPLLTESDIEQLEQQAKPLTKEVTQARESVQTTMEQAGKVNAATDKKMTPFLKKVGEEALLIADEKPNTGLTLTFPDPPKDQQTMTVTCDGGLYFDASEEIFVYLKNIILTSPEYKMSCSDELKIYLYPDNKDENSEGSKEKLKRIVATGNIVFIAKDEKGQTYIAKAEEANYNTKTETMILRGGFPSIQQSKNQYLKAVSKNEYIKIAKDGSVTTSSGSWKNKIIIPE